jgi:bifunctional UDP-N-acetylglucosamine pyrophosphorylase/glucosamine-1-phosphate N-acetyltransferase
MTASNKKYIAINEKKNQQSLRNKAMSMGVTLKAPETVFLSKDTKFGNNVEILPFTHIENATLESNVSVGPFSRIRPGSYLSKGSRVGNFVEVKKSRVGKNSKINHLSYIGDSSIGNNVNIGAGTITCNYDGKNKHKTKISDGAFIGSNTSLVAPVKIGKKSIVGAGSTITKNVKNNSLALTRSDQIEIKNYSKK